jgi:hypothetical protein
MRNDRLQGILFDQPSPLDLVQRNRRQRLVRALTGKKSSSSRRPRPVSVLPNSSPYVVIREGRRRDAELRELHARFRVR